MNKNEQHTNHANTAQHSNNGSCKNKQNKSFNNGSANNKPDSQSQPNKYNDYRLPKNIWDGMTAKQHALYLEAMRNKGIPNKEFIPPNAPTTMARKSNSTTSVSTENKENETDSNQEQNEPGNIWQPLTKTKFQERFKHMKRTYHTHISGRKSIGGKNPRLQFKEMMLKSHTAELQDMAEEIHPRDEAAAEILESFKIPRKPPKTSFSSKDLLEKIKPKEDKTEKDPPTDLPVPPHKKPKVLKRKEPILIPKLADYYCLYNPDTKERTYMFRTIEDTPIIHYKEYTQGQFMLAYPHAYQQVISTDPTFFKENFHQESNIIEEIPIKEETSSSESSESSENEESESEESDSKPHATNMTTNYTNFIQGTDAHADYLILDGGADTSSIGGKHWVIDYVTDRTVKLCGFHNEFQTDNVKIGSGITAVDLDNDVTVLLKINEASILNEGGSSLLSPLQARYYGTIINDIPKKLGGLPYIEKDGIIIPLTLNRGLMTIKIRKPTKYELQTCDCIVLTSEEEWDPDDMHENPNIEDYTLLQHDLELPRNINFMRAYFPKPEINRINEYLLYPGREATEKTLQATTQLGRISHRIPLRPHLKTRNPILSCPRLMETYATDTWFSKVTSYEGYNCMQLYCGTKSQRVIQYGMTTESNGPDTLLDFFRNIGVPLSLRRDNAKMQASAAWQDIMRKYNCKDQFIEPYNPQQNTAERRIGMIKNTMKRIMRETNCDP